MSNRLDPDQARPSPGLIWVQTVCQDYPQTTLVNKELKVELCGHDKTTFIPRKDYTQFWLSAKSDKTLLHVQWVSNPMSPSLLQADSQDRVIRLAKCLSFSLRWTYKVICLVMKLLLLEPCHEKTGFLHMRKQRRRSLPRSLSAPLFSLL